MPAKLRKIGKRRGGGHGNGHGCSPAEPSCEADIGGGPQLTTGGNTACHHLQIPLARQRLAGDSARPSAWLSSCASREVSVRVPRSVARTGTIAFVLTNRVDLTGLSRSW